MARCQRKAFLVNLTAHPTFGWRVALPKVITCLKSRTMSPRESIAHYKIVSKLGEGGMGAVYCARDTQELGIKRYVAEQEEPRHYAR